MEARWALQRASHPDERVLIILDELERVLPDGGAPRSQSDAFERFTGALRSLAQSDERVLSVIAADLRPEANRRNLLSSGHTNPWFRYWPRPTSRFAGRAATTMRPPGRCSTDAGSTCRSGDRSPSSSPRRRPNWLLGMDLYAVLPNLFGQDAATVLVLCTERYLNKHWTRVEYDAIRAAHPGRIVLLSLEGQLPDDWPEGALDLDGSPENLVQLVDLLTRRATRS